MRSEELPTLEVLTDTKAKLVPCPYCGLEMVVIRYKNFLGRNDIYLVEHADVKAAQERGCFGEHDAFATLEDAIETANKRESQETRIALRMVRDFYEHDNDAFEADCIELAKHYDKTGHVGLSEYITAQMYPQCAFVPM